MSLLDLLTAPQWTTLISIPVLYLAYHLARGKSFIISPLPSYTGPYGVGVIDLEVPVSQPGETTLIRYASGEAAFDLQTVLAAIYYPTNPSPDAQTPTEGHFWLDIPLAATTYTRFLGTNSALLQSLLSRLLTSLVGTIRIPAQIDAPFLAPPDEHRKWPVVILSHGAASGRTSYSHLCGEVAARGHVVVAIEHRDGSGGGSVVLRHGEAAREVLPLRTRELRLQGRNVEPHAVKRAQMDFRLREVEEVVRLLRRIDAGEGQAMYEANSRHEGRALRDWADRLNLRSVTMAGHSFGATLAVCAWLKMECGRRLIGLAACSQMGAFGALPVRRGDNPGSSGPLNTDVQVPVLIVNSQSWSRTHSIFYGRPHFDAVREIAEGVLRLGEMAWFMTAMGTAHTSVTDAPLLAPGLLSWTTGSMIDAHLGLKRYVDVCTAFLNFQHHDFVEDILMRPVDAEESTHCVHKRDWEIHVAPYNAEGGRA
ncbi:hypothetical protein ANO11243_035190 [Dothideomycetidae sp. 11243]|nr:hypothetical protein ANO11243_035190 [fungal sp. No.11243]